MKDDTKMRLINADSLKKTLQKWCRENWDAAFTGDDACSEFDYMIDTEDTVETAPVVHAHWIRKFFLPMVCYECSKCGRYNTSITNYCPHCGARMDEEKVK